MQKRDYSLKDMTRVDWICQSIMVVLALTMATGITFGIDVDTDRPRLGDLIRALMGNGNVKSEMWLWVARLSTLLLVITMIFYKFGPGKKKETSSE